MAGRKIREFGFNRKGQELRKILELFKLKQTSLLILTGILGYLIASEGKTSENLYLLVLSLAFAVSGTTGLNMFFDRDIDSAMFRTRKRPIPSGKIPPKRAFSLSFILLLAGVALAFKISLLVGFCVFAGFLVDLILYTLLLKRKTPLNIVVGSLAGGMPVVAGYGTFAGKLDPLSLILLSMVSLWSMAHIWVISTYYIEDYRRASIPMLPTIYSERKAISASILAISGIDLLLLCLYLMNSTSIVPFLISLLVSLPVFFFLASYLRSRKREFLKKASDF